MSIFGDDLDIRDVQLWMDAGNNGDYYLSMTEYEKNNSKDNKNKNSKTIHFRLALSGGWTSSKYPEVAKAFINLYREMEKAGLNEYPSGPQED